MNSYAQRQRLLRRYPGRVLAVKKKEDNSDSNCDRYESSDDVSEEDETIPTKGSSSNEDINETDDITIEDPDELTLTGRVLTL
mmetsp:Transcript_1214/g.2761  ORF Transcript_1214/g.2761 Transcript_1214/m.2761 type:complete len:83 (+) Transcript_1214:2879-3127(+)